MKRKTFYGKLDALGFKTYSAYLRSAHWRQVKEAASIPSLGVQCLLHGKQAGR